MSKLLRKTLLFSIILHVSVLLFKWSNFEKPVYESKKSTMKIAIKRYISELDQPPTKDLPPTPEKRKKRVRRKQTQKKEPKIQPKQVASKKAIPTLKKEEPIPIEEKVTETDPFDAKDQQNLAAVSAPLAASPQVKADLLADYLKVLQKRLEEYRSYPYTAKRMGIEGTIMVKFQVLRSGNVQELVVTAKNRYQSLAKAAKQTVRSAEPLPPPPAELGDRVHVEVPIIYHLN